MKYIDRRSVGRAFLFFFFFFSGLERIWNLKEEEKEEEERNPIQGSSPSLSLGCFGGARPRLARFGDKK